MLPSEKLAFKELPSPVGKTISPIISAKLFAVRDWDIKVDIQRGSVGNTLHGVGEKTSTGKGWNQNWINTWSL